MNIPEGLQETGKRFYEQVLTAYDLGDAHDKARLVMACRCLDEIAHDEALIEKQGRFIKDRFQQVKETVDTFRALCLEWQQAGTG